MRAILTVTMNPAIDVFATTEQVVPTHKLRCNDVRRDPGGGGVNVARIVQRFGGAVRAFYPVGGPLGELLRRLLDDEGVDSFTVDIAGDTRESFTVAEDAETREFRFVLPGPRLSSDELAACCDALAAIDPVPAYIVISGSLPPGAPDDYHARIASIARAHGARTVLDTSGPALAAALAAGVDLVKPNLRELGELTGHPLESESDWPGAAGELVTQGKAGMVALTLGKRGALLVTADGAWRADGLKIKVASAVGAGDSFLGAMVWALAEGMAPEEAFRHGVAAGSAALLTPGTGLCCRDDAERLLSEVKIRRV